jgi:hypothetical protein
LGHADGKFPTIRKYWSLIKTRIPAVATGAEQTKVQQKTVENVRLKDLKVKNYLFKPLIVPL